jgi:Ni/Co efflux regulator RcnB
MVVAVYEGGQSRPGQTGKTGPDRKVEVKPIRKFIAAATLVVGMVSLPQVPAMAQGDQHRDRNRDRQEDRRDDRRDDDRDKRAVSREWRRYDYNRFEPGQRRYDASRYYYRDDRRYRERRLGRNDRIYRGVDDRYYCRRSDGTTGLIIGGITGGVLGSVIAQGDSKTLGTLLGAGAGALVGRSIDRNNVTCR